MEKYTRGNVRQVEENTQRRVRTAVTAVTQWRARGTDSAKRTGPGAELHQLAKKVKKSFFLSRVL